MTTMFRMLYALFKKVYCPTCDGVWPCWSWRGAQWRPRGEVCVASRDRGPGALRICGGKQVTSQTHTGGEMSTTLLSTNTHTAEFCKHVVMCDIVSTQWETTCTHSLYASVKELNLDHIHHAPFLFWSFTAKLTSYLRFRDQYMSDGAQSIMGRVRRADRLRCSCRSSRTSCSADCVLSGAAPLHSVGRLWQHRAPYPFSVSEDTFWGAWRDEHSCSHS